MGVKERGKLPDTGDGNGAVSYTHLDVYKRQVYGERTEEMIEVFQKAYPGKHPTDLLAVDRVMRQPSKAIAKLHALSLIHI